MDDRDIKRELNEYLAAEYGFDSDDDPAPSEDWPFELEYIGMRGSSMYFEYYDESGHCYAAYDKGPYASFASNGMTFDDLDVEHRGSEWIDDQDPVNLDTALVDEINPVPRLHERRTAIEAMARDALGEDGEIEILEGLYLRKNRRYLALVSKAEGGEGMIVGTGFEPAPAAQWRDGGEHLRFRTSLPYAIGRLLESGRAP